MTFQLSKNQKFAIVAAGLIVPVYMKISLSFERQKKELSAVHQPVAIDMKHLGMTAMKPKAQTGSAQAPRPGSADEK